jgi:hypothetical protein
MAYCNTTHDSMLAMVAILLKTANRVAIAAFESA